MSNACTTLFPIFSATNTLTAAEHKLHRPNPFTLWLQSRIHGALFVHFVWQTFNQFLQMYSRTTRRHTPAVPIPSLFKYIYATSIRIFCRLRIGGKIDFGALLIFLCSPVCLGSLLLLFKFFAPTSLSREELKLYLYGAHKRKHSSHTDTSDSFARAKIMSWAMQTIRTMRWAHDGHCEISALAKMTTEESEQQEHTNTLYYSLKSSNRFRSVRIFGVPLIFFKRIAVAFLLLSLALCTPFVHRALVWRNEQTNKFPNS